MKQNKNEKLIADVAKLFSHDDCQTKFEDLQNKLDIAIEGLIFISCFVESNGKQSLAAKAAKDTLKKIRGEK